MNPEPKLPWIACAAEHPLIPGLLCPKLSGHYPATLHGDDNVWSEEAEPPPRLPDETIISGCGTAIDGFRCARCGRPALVDTYCCQGGASAGFDAAGFCVTGVDMVEQARYPYRLVRADAVDFLLAFGQHFAACAGSPPCQGYSKCQRIQGRVHPDLIGATRAAMQTSGRPYVIENVEDARPELIDPVLLCGPNH